MYKMNAGRKYLVDEIVSAESSLGGSADDERREQLAQLPFPELLQEAKLAREALLLAQQNEITKANRLLIARMLKDDDRRGPLS